MDDRDHSAIGESPRVPDHTGTGGVDGLTGACGEVRATVATQPRVRRWGEGAADVRRAVQG
ncbi:hypothetical protein ABGB17_34605 [Sphaerisporangium sp. B11E5]|uniref:hypothetical protein n=1 Tax=Sphaerisporangium sp. B11E5 TaxID=3153563 RepID=UPI00325C57F4